MVLAANEWLNDSDDDQKSNANSSSTAANAELTATDTSMEDSANVLSASESQTNLTITAATTAANSVNDLSNVTHFNANTNENTKLTVMTDNDADGVTIGNESITDVVNLKTDGELEKSDNNNYFNESSLLLNANANINSNSIDDDHRHELKHENANKIISNTDEYSQFGGTNKTLLSNKNPISSQALSCALESVMSSTNLNATTASNVPSNLQNNFLNALGMNHFNSFNSTFDSKTNLNNTTNKNTNINITNSENNSLDTKSIIESNGQAKIVLTCERNSHPFQTRTILLTPNIECKVGRLIAKSKASDSNAIFDCKVLSRHHAVLWYSDEGKFYVKDTNSSNGTYINEKKLDAEAAELHFGDIVKFGVDVVENTRKEVHGCIIANVKLYLPDGREAISIDSPTYRSQYSAEKKISCDELHRLNLFMQEASQREKVLKSKLFNIQNILDATRKNSGLCWQSMITEDQLLHRIHTLEKKLQIMEKNVPESALRNEILKLLDDKTAYQNSAKEALRKVYEERCDAMQMLAKMESSCATTDNECRILREQLENTNQCLQDVNSRLLNVETEYNEYKADAMHQLQEAKEQAEQCMMMLKEKLQERELECEELQQKLTELLATRAQPMNEEEKLAIEKLDAAIADMDVGDDDEEDDDDDDDDEDDDIDVDVDDDDHHERDHVDLAVTDVIGKRKEKRKAKGSNGEPDDLQREAKQVVNESTIMKWLQNSDLNKKDGSVDIFKAICNESDSSDEQDVPPKERDEDNEGAGTKLLSLRLKNNDVLETSMRQHYANFISVLECVQENLEQIDPDIFDKLQAIPLPSDKVGKANGVEEAESEQTSLSSNLYKSYTLLNTNINALREAFKSICKDVNEVSAPVPMVPTLTNETDGTIGELPKQQTSGEEVVDIDTADDSSDEDDLKTQISSIRVTTNQTLNPTNLQSYEQQIRDLADKLQHTEIESQQTLHKVQSECDKLQAQVVNLTELVEVLRSEKSKVELPKLAKESDAITETSHNDLEKSNEQPVAAADSVVKVNLTDPAQFEKHTNEELAVINSEQLQQEEELVVYKEKLERTQLDNVQLRNEIAELKLKTSSLMQQTLLKQLLPYGAVVIAIVIYILSTYY